MRRLEGDDGNAMLEFVYLAVLLMIPLVYVLLAAFSVQRAAFGVTEAARQAGRAYATAADPTAGRARAQLAGDLALSDQGIEDAPPVEVEDPDGLAPGSRVRVTVRCTVTLPVLGLLLRGDLAPTIPVRATHVEVVDAFQAAR